MCEVNSNAEDDSNTDGQINPNYGYFHCISRNCKKCGPDKVLLEILKSNEGIDEDDSLVQWQQWDWVPKKGVKI